MSRELSRKLANIINNMSTDGQIAFTSDDEENPSDIEYWYSTGCSVLDMIISNLPPGQGGIPGARITELFGDTSTGKSLIMSYIMADAQRKGDQVVLCDTETTFDERWAKRVAGFDKDNYTRIQHSVAEDIFQIIDKSIAEAKAKNPDQRILFVVDSVAQMTTKVEKAESYETGGQPGVLARIMSKAMRKLAVTAKREQATMVFTNQLRHVIGPGHGDMSRPPGGSGLPFAASVRLRLYKGQVPVDSNKNVLGMRTLAKIIKNKIAPMQGEETEFDILFDKGIDDAGAIRDKLSEMKKIKNVGSWLFLDQDKFKEKKFHKADFAGLLAKDEAFKNVCMNALMDGIIKTLAPKSI